jgi:nicotinate-nucleotide pyrophosphorylase (carboxylating)
LTKKAINQFIVQALKEDIGSGDHSSLASVPASANSKAQLLIKGDGVLAGMEMAAHIFHKVDSGLNITPLKEDGDQVTVGDIGLTVAGSARSILTSERLVLNCMQRMSGIATYTASLCEMIKLTNAQLLDTRKTTPNFRLLEKWAVAIGGGTNHRFGLYDMVMLKDNHIDFCGGIKLAIDKTKTYLKQNQLDLRIEVETRNLKEVGQVLDAGGVDVIMLDNMMPSVIKQAVEMIGDQCKIEASGGINESTIVEVAECGVDFISVGALTHSIKSMDISLKAMK